MPGWSLIIHANLALLPVRGKVIPMERLDAAGEEVVPDALLVARAGPQGVPGESIGSVSRPGLALSLTSSTSTLAPGSCYSVLLRGDGRGALWTRLALAFPMPCQFSPYQFGSSGSCVGQRAWGLPLPIGQGARVRGRRRITERSALYLSPTGEKGREEAGGEIQHPQPACDEPVERYSCPW